MRCPRCDGLHTKRDGRHGKYLRLYCRDCRKKITLNHKHQKANELLQEHLSRKSYRQLENDTGIAKKTICSFTHSVTKELIHSNELTRLLKPQDYCGIILVDGKYLPVRDLGEETLEMKAKAPGLIPISAKRKGKTKKGLVLLPFIDYETHDIPVFIICASENMHEIREGFRTLKGLGYSLRVLVCDDSMGEIAQAAQEFYPDVIIQTCLTHYKKCVERVLQVNGVKRTIRKLEKRLEKMGNSFFIPTHLHDILKAVRLTNKLADLEFEYGMLIGLHDILQEILWKAETEEDLTRTEDRMNELLSFADMKRYPHASQIRKRYLDYYAKREKITSFIRHPCLRIPRTTNLIEGFNSTTVELRLSSIRGFKKEANARNYMNALILKYRFHKFTDCKEPFKHLNRRSPIEIARPLHSLKFRSQDWVALCRELKKQPPK